MTNNKMHLKLSAIAISILLASCGGGGSDGYYEGGSTTTPDGSGSVETQTIKISDLEVLDSQGKLTRSITSTGATAKVKVTDGSGKALSSALVTFSGDGISFGTSNGAVLTNVDGIATIAVKPLSNEDTGSYQMTATVTVDGKSATTKAYNFSVQPANIGFIGMKAATTSLESGGSTLITLKTQDTTTKVNQNNVNVNFSTTCGSFDNKTVASSNQGDVVTTYKAIDENGKLCEGAQKIIATGANTSLTQAVDINIAAITANSLVYSTSGEVKLVTRNSGSASSGQIEFTVYANGVPASNQDVNIDLVRGPADLSFISVGNRTTKTIKSDALGKVVVSLYPGSLPGPVEIKATLAANNKVFVYSKNVAVATGRVSQQGLSLSTSKNSLMGDMDGDTAQVVARMVDRVGNPVPDGTTISFVSEGGSITPSCATTNGECSVTLTTQNPRPALDRVTVVAYVEGDKAYRDVDGDNMYTEGKDVLLNNIGNFFRDDNENNQYDAGEFIYKRSNGTTQCVASSLSQPNIQNTCDTKLDAVLRQQLRFAFADQTPTFVVLNAASAAKGSFNFQVFGNGLRTVPMPSGTTVSVAAKDLTENDQSCEAEIVGGNLTVPNIVQLLLPNTHPLVSNDEVKYTVALRKCAVGDEVRITTTSPRGTTKTLPIGIVK